MTLGRKTKLYAVTKDVPLTLRVRAINKEVALRKTDRAWRRLFAVLPIIEGQITGTDTELSIGFPYDDISIEEEDE